MSLKSKLLAMAAAVAVSFSPYIGKEDPIPPPGRRCFEHYECVVDRFNGPKRVASFLGNYVSYKSDQWCIMRDPVSGWPFINPGNGCRTLSRRSAKALVTARITHISPRTSSRGMVMTQGSSLISLQSLARAMLCAWSRRIRFTATSTSPGIPPGSSL